jgi:hypothetical protein
MQKKNITAAARHMRSASSASAMSAGGTSGLEIDD